MSQPPDVAHSVAAGRAVVREARISITWRRLLAIGVVLLSGMWAVPRAAFAVTPYQGIYVVINPYNVSQQGNLKSAAQTSCAGQTPVTTPFCGAANGVMLRIPWCDFQLYHVNNGPTPLPSCHYQVAYANWPSTTGVQTPSTDLVSPCHGLFDTCAGATRSVLGASLRAIGQINTQRANAGLPPLQLSIGMFAGIGTPQSVLDSVGSVDVPDTTNAALTPSTFLCYRLPLAWKPQFVQLYDQAIDQLIAYVQMQMPQGANWTIFKTGGISGTDLELEVPGQAQFFATATDPGPAGQGGALNCPTTLTGAQVWLNAYTANPLPGQSFAQAYESTFGHFIGHALGALANNGLTGTLISMATTNTSGFAYVDCGPSGAVNCHVAASSGKWAVYYFEKNTADLFNGGLAYTAAQSAYQAIRGDTFALPASQLSINSTGLVPTPAIVSGQQISCNMNNTVPALAPTFLLDNAWTSVVGVGSSVGWQTQVNQGGECSSNLYWQALSNGIADAGQFIEVEPDAAFSNINQCSPYLSKALSQILGGAAPATCWY